MKTHKTNITNSINLMNILCQSKNMLFEFYINKKDPDYFYLFKYEILDYYQDSGIIVLRDMQKNNKISFHVSKLNCKIETDERVGTFCSIEMLEKNINKYFDKLIVKPKNERVEVLMNILRNQK